MAIAVGRAFPDAIHRLCRWHIIDGHSDHLNTIFMRHKDIEIEMMVCINQAYMPMEFENAWKEFIDKFGLHDSTVLRDLYDIRHRWVPAFFKEDYCGRMTSTQRSESFNRLVKSSFVDHQTALHRFARRILEVALSRKEKKATETRAYQAVPIVKTTWPFAEQLSRVYTRAVFKVFENTLDESVHFRIEQYGVDQTQWIISHSKRLEKHDYCQRQFKVTADVVNGQFSCLFCPHLLRAFVHVQVEKIPHTYVLRRYSKEAKSDVNFDRRDRPISGPDGVKLSYRTKVLSLDAQQLVKWGRRSSVAFERATSVMKVLRKQLEEIPADVHGLDVDDGVKRLTPSPVMREVDLPPEFCVRGSPTPDWPPPPTESDEERFREDLEQYYNDGYVSTPCPSPPSDLFDCEENLEDGDVEDDNLRHGDVLPKDNQSKDTASPPSKRKKV
nr:protein FAR1-RELATED SEQUENCE 5 [Oryza sativa Japonica Group]